MQRPVCLIPRHMSVILIDREEVMSWPKNGFNSLSGITKDGGCFSIDLCDSSKEYVYIKETGIKRKLILHNKERKKMRNSRNLQQEKTRMAIKEVQKAFRKRKIKPKDITIN